MMEDISFELIGLLILTGQYKGAPSIAFLDQSLSRVLMWH